MTFRPHHSDFFQAGQDAPRGNDRQPVVKAPAELTGEAEQAPAGSNRACQRHQVEIWGKFRYNGRGYEVVLLDLSATGCRFFDRHGRLGVGTPLRIMIAGIGPFDAEVRWRERGYVGLKFCTPMYDPVLEHIVRLSSQKN